MDEKLYELFPLHDYEYTGFLTFSGRNERNLSDEFLIEEQGRLVTWKPLDVKVPKGGVLYVKMFSRAQLNPHFISASKLVIGREVMQTINAGVVAPGIEYIDVKPIYGKKIFADSAPYFLPRCGTPVDLGYKLSFKSTLSLGSQVPLERRFGIDYFVRRDAELPWDFFCFGSKFALSERLAEDLAARFPSLAFDPILFA